jgi:hypothetical protein
MPGLLGRLWRRSRKASSPPAEAPMPTTGKEGGEPPFRTAGALLFLFIQGRH